MDSNYLQYTNCLTVFSATQELKVLVDLALISAGESDMETDRISSLHTSCLGFAPLIYDLKESQEHKVNFDQLMKACDPVWKAVEADKTLPKKLVRSKVHAFLFKCQFFQNEYPNFLQRCILLHVIRFY